MRCAISISSSFGVKSTRRLTKLKRTPRTPASCSSRSSPSVTPRFTVATPRALPLDRAQRVDQRAVVGAVAGRLHDRRCARSRGGRAARRAASLLRVAGRVLALGREGKLRARAEHVAMRVHRARRQRESAASTGRDGTVEPAGGLLESVVVGSPPSMPSSIDVLEPGLRERLAHLVHVEAEHAGGELLRACRLRWPRARPPRRRPAARRRPARRPRRRRRRRPRRPGSPARRRRPPGCSPSRASP